METDLKTPSQSQQQPAADQPKKQWHLRNGVMGRPGPGRPRHRASWPKPQALCFSAERQKTDWAAVIARAVFEQNPELIYRAMSKKLFRGDARVFQTLANRGYGLPPQELAIQQEKPLKLTIEYIGGKGSEVMEAVPGRANGCLTDGEKTEGE